MLWNGNEQDGDVRSEGEVDEGTDCEDGDSDTECTKLIVKYFFLAHVIFGGVILDTDKYIFSWQMCFFFQWREVSFYIRVVLHLGKYSDNLKTA